MSFFARIWLALSVSIIFLAGSFQVMAQATDGKTGIVARDNEKTVVGQVFTADENSFNGRLLLGHRGGVKFANEGETPYRFQTIVLIGPQAELSFASGAFRKVEIELLEAQSSGVFTFKVDYTKGQADHLTIIDSIDQDPEQKVAIYPQATSVTQADNIPLILDKSKNLVFHLQDAETIKLGDEYYKLMPELTDKGVVWSLRHR